MFKPSNYTWSWQDLIPLVDLAPAWREASKIQGDLSLVLYGLHLNAEKALWQLKNGKSRGVSNWTLERIKHQGQFQPANRLLLRAQGRGAPEAKNGRKTPLPPLCCVEIPGLWSTGWQGLEPCREQQLRAGSCSISPVLISFAGGAPQTRGRSEITDGSGGESQRHN